MKKIILSLFAILLILLGCGDTNHEVSTGPGTSAPTGAVQGFVRDYKTNAAIEDVTVTLYAAGTRTTTTDAVGYWYFDGVRADDGPAAPSLVYTLTAPDADLDGSADYLPMMGLAAIDETVGSTVPPVAPEYGQTNSLTLVTDWMVQTATVSGFVTDSTSGQGINGATVVLLDFLTTTPGLGAGQWGPGFSNARVDCATLTATTAARTEGGDGYYSFTTVPALTIILANFGAYASGYEYNAGAAGGDATAILNLQYGSSAIVDFQLNPLDNALGLVVASVTTATDTTTNMMILRDSTGGAPTALDALVDMNGATQLVFNLIFDQAIDATSFYGDTIQLRDVNGVVGPNLTPVWTTGNYALTLTGNIDIFDDVLANPYKLRTSRTILAAGDGINIGAATDLAQFNAYNSTFVATNPTPALYLKDTDENDDAFVMGHDGVYTYDTSDTPNNPTTAMNYTGTSERNLKNTHNFAALQAYDTDIDVYWTDTQPTVDVSGNRVWYRVTNASGEVLTNWTDALGTPVLHDDQIIFQDLAIAGLVNNELRYDNQINIAVTGMDTLGVETAIDTTKMLTLSDTYAPELAVFGAASYQDGTLDFSEEMDTTATVTVTPSNIAIVTISAPTWAEQDDTFVGTRLKLNATGTASDITIDGTTITITVGGLITLATENAANAFYIGQSLRLTYYDDSTQNVTVTALSTATAAPTITVTAPTGDITESVTASVHPDNAFRDGFFDNGTDTIGAAATQITFAPGLRNVAIGDTLIVRDSSNAVRDVTVTVTDIANAVVQISGGTNLVAAHDDVYFKGDVLTVVAQDEAGNVIHSDADQIANDTVPIWPSIAPAAGDAIF